MCTVHLPSEISLSRISHANMVGFSRLYCSILETTAGVATFGFDPPIRPGGRNVPVIGKSKTKKKKKSEIKMISQYAQNSFQIKMFVGVRIFRTAVSSFGFIFFILIFSRWRLNTCMDHVYVSRRHSRLCLQFD